MLLDSDLPNWSITEEWENTLKLRPEAKERDGVSPDNTLQIVAVKTKNIVCCII